MASRGANVAAGGSGLKDEGKFRQRVDDHYKSMAAGKKGIGSAYKVHLGSALCYGTAGGVVATKMEEEWAMPAAALCAVLVLATGLCAKAAKAASDYPAGSKDVEKRLQNYNFHLRGIMWMLRLGLALGVYALQFAQMAVPTEVKAGAGLLGSLSLGGYFLGSSASSKLGGAFEQMRNKAAK